jgi:hypothetical protein
VEARVGRPDNLRRLSDEDLEARYKRLLPKAVDTLARGDEREQQLGRALSGKRLRDLAPGEHSQLLAWVQARR